jgi:hypothetical protein
MIISNKRGGGRRIATFPLILCKRLIISELRGYNTPDMVKNNKDLSINNKKLQYITKTKENEYYNLTI